VESWKVELLDVNGDPVPGGLYLVQGDKLTAANTATWLCARDLQAVSERVSAVTVNVPLDLGASGAWIRIGVELPVDEWGRVLAAWELKQSRARK
jgi:hypothetical protein